MRVLTASQDLDAIDPATLPSELDSPSTMVLVLGDSDRIRTPDGARALQRLAEAFPSSLLAGCSTAGEICGGLVQDGSLSITVVRFDHTRLYRALAGVSHAADSAAAGRRLALALMDRPDAAELAAVLVISDGLHVNGSRLVEGMASGLPASVPIIGGLAGDGSRFGATWVLDHARPVADRVCAIGLYGRRLRVGHGCGSGWSDFGPQRSITRSQGNVLYELDGQPALALYKRYLGERADGLPGTALLFPLAVRRHAQDREPLIRTVLSVDEATQSMTFAGDLPEGGIARLMRTSNERLIDSAGQAALDAVRQLDADVPGLALSVSCVGRRLVLGERTEEEVEAVQEHLPAGSVHVGFYAYGEISPSVPGGASELHNQTMTVSLLCEV